MPVFCSLINKGHKMKISICGSLVFEEKMLAVQKTLEEMGFETNVPRAHERANDYATVRKEMIDNYFGKISASDAILVVNETKGEVENYIGGNTLMEMGYAYAQGLEVFLLNPVPDQSYAIEIEAMQPIVLDGQLEKIEQYFSSLPFAYMSTESPVKQLATSRGLRRAGMRVRIAGLKVESGVNEQPMSIDETYTGAMTRHDNLKSLGKEADYFVTIESGQHQAHKDHSLFGCAVVIIEKAGEQRKVGIDLDVEFPREMLDKVPSQYPDLGVLVQQEYGSILKDPYPFFTNNKLTRAKLLENAVYNLVVQMEDTHGN